MPWYFPWSESIKKRACRYLLQHYLGDFLKEKLDLDQLTVDLYNGKGTVSNVPLDVWALNEMMSNAGIPLELINGYISSISVSVPWKALLSDSCEIEIRGLNLTFCPKQMFDEESLVDSTYSWNSMTTSMQLAQECLRQDKQQDDQADVGQSFEGLEAFAQTIESVLARVRLSFIDTLVRLENIPQDSKSGVGVELHIDRMDYWDLSHDEVNQENQPKHSVYELVAVAIKNFQLTGINLYLDEFPRHKRTRLREAFSDENLDQMFHDPLHGIKDHSEVKPKYTNREEEEDNNGLLPQVKILSSCGKQNIKLKLKQNDEVPGPKIDMDYSLAGLNIFLTPRQMHLLIDTVNAIPDSAGSVSGDDSEHTRNSYHQTKNRMREMKSDDYMKVEESLQNQFHSIECGSWKQTFNSLKSGDTDAYASLGQQSTAAEDEEFFSMTDFPLPALGQPTLVNTVKQHNISSNMLSGSPTSPRSTLSNISLGGSSGSLSTKGTLTERASTVFKASSAGSSGPKFNDPISSPSSNGNIGLAGVSSIDDSIDITRIKLRSSNIIFMLLHRDPIISKSDTNIRDKEFCLCEMSEMFFSHVNQYARQSLFGLDGEEIRENLLSVCSTDHIRVLASAVTIENEIRNISGVKTISTDFIVGKLIAEENLYDSSVNKDPKIPYSQTKLLEFKLQEESPLYPGSFGSSLMPCVKVKHTKTQRSNFAGVQSRSTVLPKSSVTVDLAALNTEVDLTVIDRIACILWPGPLYKMSAPLRQSVHNMYASLATGRSANTASAFRQVIDDIPMYNDVNTDLNVRCSEANVLLRFPVPDLRPASDIDKRPWWRKAIHNESLQIRINLFELKTSLNANSNSSSTYDITFQSAIGTFLALESSFHVFDIHAEDVAHASVGGANKPRILIQSAAPFSAVFDEMSEQSKNSSPDSIEDQYPWLNAEPSPFATQQTMYENEEMLLPGSIAEMNAFQEMVTMSSKLAINCYLPDAQINLHNSKVFELFYNRLLGDLAMWEPQAPSAIDSTTKQMNPYESVHINLASHIGELGGGNDKFFMCKSAIRDVYDSHDTESSFSTDFADSPNKQPQQTNMCISVHIDHGSIAIFPPCKTTPDVSKESTTSTNTFPETPDTSFSTTPEEYAHVILRIKDGHFFTTSGYKGQKNFDFLELYSNAFELYHSDCMSITTDLYRMSDALNTRGLSRTIYCSDDDVRTKFKPVPLGSDIRPMLSLAMKSTSNYTTNRKDNLLSVVVDSGTLCHRILSPGHSWLFQLMDFMDIKDYPIIGYTFPSTVTSLHTHLWKCAIDYKPLNIPIHSLLTVETFSLSSNLTPDSRTSILRFLIDDSKFHIFDKSKKPEADYTDYVQVMDMGMFELSLKITDGLDTKQPIVDLAMSNNLFNIRTCADSCTALMKLIKYFAMDGDLQNTKFDHVENYDTGDSQLDVTLSTPQLQENEIRNEVLIDDLVADAMQDDDSIDNLDGEFSSTVIDQRVTDYDIDDDSSSSSDEFCFLDNDTATQDTDDVEPVIRQLSNQPIRILDDYFQIPLGKHDLLGSPEGYPPATYRYTVREMSLVWQMYGGSDFDGATKSDDNVDKRGFPKKQQGLQSNQVAGGPNRKLDTMMELLLNKVRFQHEIYPEDSTQIYRDVLVIYDVEVRDRLASSQINKFLYRFSSESLPKQSSANMEKGTSQDVDVKNQVTFKLLVTKPEDAVRNQEASIRLSLQPLRLNVDQVKKAEVEITDSLFFLRAFFSEIAGTEDAKPDPLPVMTDLSSSPGQEPFQAFADSPTGTSRTDSPDVLRHNNMSRNTIPSEASGIIPPNGSTESCKTEQRSNDLFIKSFVFSPEVPIRLDYQGKHVVIEQGTLAGLIIGLSQLNCSEIRLKRLCCRSGLLGFDRLLSFVLQEWLTDIKQNQLQSILRGVGPTYSFLQLYQGIKDLFWMPIQQYKQDGRIVRGLQRGAHSFSTSTTLAVLELSNRLVSTIQGLAEMTFDMVSSGPSHTSSLPRTMSGTSSQPAELREGVARAYTVISEGLSQTASNMVRVATQEHEKKGVTGAVGGILRQIPPTVVKPLILATEATSNVLDGAMNQLAPDKRREALEKWKMSGASS